MKKKFSDSNYKNLITKLVIIFDRIFIILTKAEVASLFFSSQLGSSALRKFRKSSRRRFAAEGAVLRHLVQAMEGSKN